MKFKLSKEQIERFEKWEEEMEFSQTDAGAVGGAYSFIFTPTGVGDFIKIRHISGAELDLTDMDDFAI